MTIPTMQDLQKLTVDELKQLNHRVVETIKTIRRLESIKKSATLGIGMKVRSNPDVRPHKFANLDGEIIGIRGMKFVVKTKMGDIRMPPNCIELVK